MKYTEITRTSDPTPTIILKDYNKSTAGRYRGGTSRMRVPNNVNNYNHNVLGLTNHCPTSFNGKNLLFTFNSFNPSRTSLKETQRANNIRESEYTVKGYATVRDDIRKEGLEALTCREVKVEKNRVEPLNSVEYLGKRTKSENKNWVRYTGKSSFNYYESAEAFSKTRANLQAEIEAMQNNEYPAHSFSSRIVNCMGAVLSQRTERSKKKQEKVSKENMKTMNYEIPKDVSIVNEYFGINHGQVREHEKETMRETLRESITLNLQREQEKAIREKNKL